MVVGKLVVSNRVIGPMPDAPLRRACQVGSDPIPRAETNPTPVTTTRRLSIRPSLSLAAVGLDIVDGILDRLYFLSILVGNLNAEGFLKRHNQLDRIQGIGAQIIYKGRSCCDFSFVDPQLVHNNRLHL